MEKRTPTKKDQIEETDPIQGISIKQIEINYARLLSAVTIASLIFKNLYFTLGILIGGSVCLLNFRGLRASVQRTLIPHQTPAKVNFSYFVGFFSRFILVALMTLYIFKLGPGGLVGFILGLSLILVAITLTGVSRAIQEQKRKRS